MRRGIKSQSKRCLEIFIHPESPFFREGHMREGREEGELLKVTIFYSFFSCTLVKVLGYSQLNRLASLLTCFICGFYLRVSLWCQIYSMAQKQKQKQKTDGIWLWNFSYGTTTPSWDQEQGFSTSALLTFWARLLLAGGTIRSIIGCLETSLASTQWMSLAPPPVRTTKASPVAVKWPPTDKYCPK